VMGQIHPKDLRQEKGATPSRKKVEKTKLGKRSKDRIRGRKSSKNGQGGLVIRRGIVHGFFVSIAREELGDRGPKKPKRNEGVDGEKDGQRVFSAAQTIAEKSRKKTRNS